MLISDHKQFIFIHIYKNAGISITEALIPHVVPRIVWKTDRLTRACGFPLVHLNRYPRHISASELREQIGTIRYNKYYSFAVVRNPWAWQVSLYHYMRQSSAHPEHELALGFRDFAEYIHWRCNEAVAYQKDFIVDSHDKLIVDQVLRFEALDDEFTALCSKLGIRAQLPYRNTSASGDWRLYYTDLTRDLVARTFARDIKYFGYDFDQTSIVA